MRNLPHTNAKPTLNQPRAILVPTVNLLDTDPKPALYHPKATYRIPTLKPPYKKSKPTLRHPRTYLTTTQNPPCTNPIPISYLTLGAVASPVDFDFARVGGGWLLENNQNRIEDLLHGHISPQKRGPLKRSQPFTEVPAI